MPCYHPLIRSEIVGKYLRAQDGHLYNEAKIFGADLNARKIIDKERWGNYHEKLIPCGKCLGCRLDYAREWANRGFLESKCYGDNRNWFVTLTYDDEHLKINDEIIDKDGISYWNEGDWNGTLVPGDFAKFMHELRKIMSRKPYFQDGIRFMGCGEYGEQGERPHYHIILFNCYLPANTFYEPRLINKEFYYRNTIIERAWKKGISNICEATWNTINYTARYITKKVNGKESNEHYASRGQEKEFLRCSRMPGIGKPYYDLHKHEIYKNDNIIIHNKAGIVTSKPPKYFDKLYEMEFPEEMKKIKRRRRMLQERSEAVQRENHSYSAMYYKAIQERTIDERTAKLIREMEKHN